MSAAGGTAGGAGDGARGGGGRTGGGSAPRLAKLSQLREWAARMADYVDSIRPRAGLGTTETQTRTGIAINANPSPAAGGGGGGNETVTGAVNGVPSTLNVLTDGNGWTAI